MISRRTVAAIVMMVAACSAGPPRIETGDGWARETARAGSAAVYMSIANRGESPDILVAARTGRGRASLHRSDTAGGIARMRPASEGLAVPAGGTLRLSPGGAHIMIDGLQAPLKQGDRFAVTLQFERSAPKQVEITVKPAGATSHAGH